MAHVTVHGRLSRDPELSFVPVKGDQKAVCRFSVAEDKRFGEDASFFDCQRKRIIYLLISDTHAELMRLGAAKEDLDPIENWLDDNLGRWANG